MSHYQMAYAPFTPLPPTSQEPKVIRDRHELRQGFIQKFAEANGYVRLNQADTETGTDSYFYNPQDQKMYKAAHFLKNDESIRKPFERCDDEKLISNPTSSPIPP